jgi:hypothetical protein
MWCLGMDLTYHSPITGRQDRGRSNWGVVPHQLPSDWVTLNVVWDLSIRGSYPQDLRTKRQAYSKTSTHSGCQRLRMIRAPTRAS